MISLCHAWMKAHKVLLGLIGFVSICERWESKMNMSKLVTDGMELKLSITNGWHDWLWLKSNMTQIGGIEMNWGLRDINWHQFQFNGHLMVLDRQQSTWFWKWKVPYWIIHVGIKYRMGCIQCTTDRHDSSRFDVLHKNLAKVQVTMRSIFTVFLETSTNFWWPEFNWALPQ